MVYTDFVAPAWLGPTPFSDFTDYGFSAERAWFDIPWQYRRGQALFFAHTEALKGSPHNLELMKTFYANLVTYRIKQGT